VSSSLMRERLLETGAWETTESSFATVGGVFVLLIEDRHIVVGVFADFEKDVGISKASHGEGGVGPKM